MNRELTNQILHLNRREFAIQEVIGRGASCVVYRAICPDNTEHLLKEYNPRHIAMYREDNGELCLESEEDREAFEAGLARFREGHALQRRLRLDRDLKNSTSNIQEIYSGNGTEYIDMTRFAGQSYEKVREKSVYNLMRRMKALTQVIRNYHKAGLLHLDIKPQNMFTIPETCELVMLFDFDSVVTKETAAMGGAHSYSKDWSAPEQRNPLKRRSICEATDLFAVGKIIFWQLMGRNSTAEDHRSFATYTFEHDVPIFENVNPQVFPLLNDLLHHTICAPIDQRCQSAEELIAKLDAIIKIADPKEPYLKSSALSMQDFFIGRDAEIQEIHDRLNENRILFLSGIGGIGKSELAKHYAEAYRSSYDTVIFAPYVNDVNTLIANDDAIPIYRFNRDLEEKPHEYYARKLRKLHELCDERTLLIVDNLDSDEDPDIPKLLELGCKLLITTRMDLSGYGLGQFLYIDALRNKTEIRDIFDKYYTKYMSADEENYVDQIIDLVAGHTMTVELLAKQMMAGRVKPEAMLAKLQEGGISESGKEKVHSGKDGIMSAQSTYCHIRALFDLSKLDEEEQYILANLSLIPYTGIATELFHNWCKIEDYEVLNSLVIAGWVTYNQSTDWVALHPVVQEICADIWKHTDWEKNDNFAVRLLESYGDVVYGYYYEYVIPIADITYIVNCHQPFYNFVSSLHKLQYSSSDHIDAYLKEYTTLNHVLSLRAATTIIAGLYRLQYNAEAIIHMLDIKEQQDLFASILSIRDRMKNMAKDILKHGLDIRAKTTYVKGFEEVFSLRVFGIVFVYLFFMIEDFDSAEKEIYKSWELRHHKSWMGKIEEMDSLLAHELSEMYQYKNDLDQTKKYHDIAIERFAEEYESCIL